MLWSIIQGFIRHTLTGWGAILVTKGLASTPDVSTAVGAIMVLVGIVHSIAVKWNSQSSGPSAPSGGGVSVLLALMAISGTLFTTGCSITSIAKNGDIISTSTRGLGVHIVMTSASSTLPQVDAGLFSENIQLIPSSTNELFSPDFASVASADSGYDPFNIGGNESSASGLSSTYYGTNVVVQPQYPMTWPTNQLK